MIIRVHKNATRYDYNIELGSTTKQLILESANPGSWAKNYLIKVVRKQDELDPDDPDPTLCNIEVYENLTPNQPDPNQRKLILLESFKNTSLDPTKRRYIGPIIENGSELVRIKSVSPGLDSGIGDEVTYESNMNSDPNNIADGIQISATEIQGTVEPKRGLHLLEDVDIFNLLCIPSFRVDDTPETSIDDLVAMYDDAYNMCEKKRAFLIVDPLVRWNNKDKVVDDFKNTFPKPKKKNAAIFFPRIICPDKGNENRPRSYPPCGAIAGIMARTDIERGIWKAPAGLNASLSGVVGLTVNLNDEENGDLNKLGANCLRTFFAGPVVWGARTLRGDDRFSDEWKYIPVRRTALYIEESLYRGTQWIVFEPNDERLWAQIRLNIGAFMHDLFTKGAFQGTDPKKAYFVKCDSETTTQTDINRGIVNIVVGFAPLIPV